MSRETFILPVKPLSINEAFQGRRFNTKAKTRYEEVLALLIPKKPVIGKWFKVYYDFYLRNFPLTDADNLVKVLQDCIVKRGVIPNDNKIVHYVIRKFRSDEDLIEVRIDGLDEEPKPEV